MGLYPEWMADALCAEVDPERFFPEQGGSTRDAKRICARCDAKEACLEWALQHPELVGIWGGTAKWERERMDRPQRTPPATTRPELATRVKALAASGLSDGEVSLRCGMSVRQVARIRAATDIPNGLRRAA